MRNKYGELSKQMKAVSEDIAATSGWSEEQVQTALWLLLEESVQQINATVTRQKVTLTRELLKHYRTIKKSVGNGFLHSLNLLNKTKYQRLMQREESVKNQQVHSVAVQMAANEVLWVRLNTALNCLKDICSQSSVPRIHRQYDLIYDRYLADKEISLEDIFEKHHIERTIFYKDIGEGINTLAIILFGANCAADLYSLQLLEA